MARFFSLKSVVFISALILLTSLSNAQPGDIGNKIMLAQQFEQLNQLEKAKTIYLDVYKANPNDYMFLESVVRVCNRLKQYEESLGYLGKWNTNHPGDINGINLLGKTHFLSGNEKEALKVWDDFLKISNYDINYTKVLAYSAIEVKGFETAIYLLEKGKETSGRPVYFLLDLGYLYGYMMQYDKAAEAYVELLDLEPNQASQVDARVRNTSNNPEAAVEYIKAFEKTEDPNEPTLRVLFGLYIDQRMFPKAIETALKLEESGKENGVSLYRSGEEAFYAADFASATTAYTKLLELYPNRPDKPVINLNLVKSLEETLNLEYLQLNPAWKPYDRGILPAKEKYEVVLDKYSEIISTFKTSETASEAIFRSGYIHYKLKEYSEAIDKFDELIEKRPNSQFAAHAWLHKGYIYLRQDETGQAEFAFRSAINSFSTDPDVKNRAKFSLMMCYFFRNEATLTTELLTEIISTPTANLANDAFELAPLMNKNIADSLSMLPVAEGEKFIMQGLLAEAFNVLTRLAPSSSKVFAAVARFR
ncbi:MAG: hypothetical protein HBSAPP04_24840 [Ignavibacteriaceae bacterium]|nr:MAG: hypothetical protein HBSAPP04_24840 [Ignavibacteriaceae bacterium]